MDRKRQHVGSGHYLQSRVRKVVPTPQLERSAMEFLYHPAHGRPHRRALRLSRSCNIQRIPQRHGRAHFFPQNRLGISRREAIEPPRTA